MPEAVQTLVILSPAFAESESDSWLPAQEAFVRSLNRNYPALKVVVLTFHFPVAAQKNYTWFGNEITAFNGSMKGGLHSARLWAQVWKKLKALHRQHNLLGIFCFFCSECAFVGHYFARRYNLPHKIWILGQDARAGNKQVKRIRPAANELIAISDFLVREFEHNYGTRPAHMIPTGIDATAFAPAGAVRDIDIMAAGSLIPLKQYELFIETVARLAKLQPGLKAVLCGDGIEMEQLRSRTKQLGLENMIRFTGSLPHKEVLALMQHSKVFLHPSSYEGFGMVCAEALYAGAQVISFCKPLDINIPHWHVVAGIAEMIATASHLLQQTDVAYNTVMTFSVDDTARQIMECFGYTL